MDLLPSAAPAERLSIVAAGQRYNKPVTVVPLDLKVKLLRSEALEALLYGCDTWTLRRKDYDKLRTHHHRMLLRCIRFQKKRTDHRLSYHFALEKTGSESIETTVRRRRLVLADPILRLGDHRLPKRLVVDALREGTDNQSGSAGANVVAMSDRRP